MAVKTWVLIDHAKQKIREASWEALAMGRQIADQISGSLQALILGHDVRALAEEVSKLEMDSVLLIEDERLSAYDPDLYCEALKGILGPEPPDLLLLAHSYQNMDFAPKLAGALQTALITDCTGYRVDNGKLAFTRQMFRNKLNALVSVHSPPPWMVTVQSGAFTRDDLRRGEGAILAKEVDLSSVQPRRRPLETIEAMKGKVDLSKAEIIVGVGRGIKNQDNLKIIEELAEVLGAEIGASRPVVDNEWMARERQIGSSGQNVSPRLYVACGVSGAIQHLVGMKGSQCIVAINTDPNAPIFNVAHYGIVGDLLEVVPALTRKLKEGGLG